MNEGHTEVQTAPSADPLEKAFHEVTHPMRGWLFWRKPRLDKGRVFELYNRVMEGKTEEVMGSVLQHSSDISPAERQALMENPNAKQTLFQKILHMKSRISGFSRSDVHHMVDMNPNLLKNPLFSKGATAHE